MSDDERRRESRLAELEGELAAAQRTIDVLIARLERSSSGSSPTQAELFDAAVRLGHVLEERTREVEEARAEFRALRANLDQIVKQRTRALAESEAKLRTTNIELERQSKIKAEFISIAAHELRTPLTSIVGYLDLFSEGRFGTLPPLLERPMSSVRRNAHRLKRLVTDMLSVSRIQDGRITLRIERVDVGEVVGDVVTELLPLANARKQTLEKQVEDIDPIDADHDKLHQIVVNLVSNAIRYTPEEGRITISVDAAPRDRYPGGWARMRVRDNGIGIADEDRPRIFDPFLHAQPAKHHTSAGPDSAGLGLYIARGLIERHGGLITVDSQPGVFTEFTVLLPFKSLEKPPSDPPVARLADAAYESASFESEPTGVRERPPAALRERRPTPPAGVREKRASTDPGSATRERRPTPAAGVREKRASTDPGAGTREKRASSDPGSGTRAKRTSTDPPATGTREKRSSTDPPLTGARRDRGDREPR